MAQASFSGSQYTKGSLTLEVDGAFLRRDTRPWFRTKRESFSLVDYEHAGVAWVENPNHETIGHRGGPLYGGNPRYLASLWLWHDTQSFEDLCLVLLDADESFKALPKGVDTIASTAAGQFATLLDTAIASARTTPAPRAEPGSYLTVSKGDNVHAVWIPTLGASNTF